MTVTLTTELENFIAEQIRSGHFLSANDVIVQSLGLLREQEGFISSNTAELREKINAGLEQIRRGETVDAEAALQQLREKLRQRETRRQMKVRISSDADRDIEEIANYIFEL